MMVFVRSALLSGVAAVALAMQGSALAQATLSNLLGMVNVNPSSKAGSCSQIDIALNRPVNVTETTPAQKGMEITIRLEPLGTQQSSDSTSRLAEAATVPAQNPAGLGIVSYNPAGQTGPEIHLVFAKAMAYKLRRDENDRHIVLDVSDPSASASCLGIKTSDKQENTKSDLPQAFEGKGKITEDVPGSASSDDATAALAQGKKLLAAGDFSKAGAFFTKATNLGTGKVKQEALEMLGLAHERAGQLPFAKSEYESYLKQYPGGQRRRVWNSASRASSQPWMMNPAKNLNSIRQN